MAKKLVRSVTVDVNGTFVSREIGVDDVVSIISINDTGVRIYFRAEGEIEGSTTRQIEDRPMTYYSGYPFIIEDRLK